jgi:hypothetical protein
MNSGPADGLCFEMAEPRSSSIVCDVSELAPDAMSIDALARLQLGARRLGVEIRLRHASHELVDLLGLVGLREVLGVEAGREAEEREQRVGVEEEREFDDSGR